MTTKKYIYGLFAVAALSLSSCDYNEKHFPGFDDAEIVEVVKYEADFAGAYPKAGYFEVEKNGSDFVLASAAAGDFQKSVNDQMKKAYPYADKESTARLNNILVAQIIKGAFKSDEAYTLERSDYDAMGTGKDQPGSHDNFDDKMDIDSYLIPFCATKYADAAVGTTVTITYKFYNKGVSNQTRIYEKTADAWVKSAKEGFAFTKSFTLSNDDYDAMGTGKNEPGNRDNFSSSVDPRFYLPIFLKQKYAYAKEGDVFQIYYKYYANKETTTQSIIYRLEDNAWMEYDPYKDEAIVSSLNADLLFDGSNWVLTRLFGNSVTVTMAEADYKLLYDWVKENKKEYVGVKYNNEEYYFGVSTYHNNVNNKFKDWRGAEKTGKADEYTAMSDEKLLATMHERMATGLATLVLPANIKEPDAKMAYVVLYNVYGEQGKGELAMNFKYDGKAFVFVSGPAKN